jgi:serine protease
LNRADSETLMRQLAADPNVEYVEIDAIMKPTLVPNDPSLSSQWALGTSNASINVRPAWDKATGNGVVVAVLDTGTTVHPDLSPNYLPGYDFISDPTVARDGNGRDSDPSDPGDKTSGTSSWHGTHVAGTIGALTNNGVGVAGVAYGAKILPVRVLGVGGGYTSDIADAIVWASGGTVSGVPANPYPAEVINMSLGGSGTCSTTYQNAINSAVARGTTVVVAAGNSNTNVSNAQPANCANVIAVAATTSAGARSSFSNYGTGITISAPGSNILSTLNSGTTSPGNPSYAYYDGTSMAAPHVAGVVALMQSVASTPLTPAQVTTILKNTARPLPGACSGGCGAGIVNAEAAVNAVLASSPQPVTVLQNGVPVTGLSGAINSERYFTITVPANSSNLVITKAAGGTGDADLYVRFGSQPTTSAYDCRPYVRGTGVETCTFATPQAGTYHVMLRGYAAFTGVTLTGSYQAGSTVRALQNGVPVTGLSGATNSEQYFTISVPANSRNLVITKPAGGTGDADLYVRFGSQPTTSAYDCRPYLGGTSAETCTFASPQAGTYHVMLRGYAAFTGVTLTGSYEAAAAVQTYTNSTMYQIRDNSTVESPITVSGRSGNAPTNAVVSVNITHTWRGDLVVDLVAPNGTTTNLHNRTGGSAQDIVATYTLNLSGKPLNGTWKLRVTDAATGDTGYIRSWSVRF